MAQSMHTLTRPHLNSSGMLDGSPKLSGPSPETFLVYLNSISPNALPVYLILFSFFIITIIVYLGRSLLGTCSPLVSPVSMWQSLKDFCNRQRKRKDFRHGEQQEREDKTKGKTHIEVPGSMEGLRTSAPKTYKDPKFIRKRLDVFATQLTARLSIVLSTKNCMAEVFAQVVSKLISGRPKVLERLCNLATLWALLGLPRVVAAYGSKRDDVIIGYGVILAGIALVMVTILVSTVRDSVQRHRKSLRDSVRRRLEKLSYIVWFTGVLLAMVIILASAFNDVNDFKAVDSITDP